VRQFFLNIHIIKKEQRDYKTKVAQLLSVAIKVEL